MNDRLLVDQVIAELRAAGFEALLMGGWGEEILGLAVPRRHEDVDVLLVDPALTDLDRFVAARDEILDGHLSHKRAYRRDGVKVELFIAQRHGNVLETVFWDRLVWTWPSNMQPIDIDGLSVAPKSALRGFRESFPHFMAARNAAVDTESASADPGA
jgi:hypothetical protein